MKITEIRVRKTFTEGALRAIVSVTLDDQLAVHDLKVISTSGRTFLAMPNKKLANGRYKDTAHPINSEFREMLEKAIMPEYEKALSESEGG